MICFFKYLDRLTAKQYFGCNKNNSNYPYTKTAAHF